MSYNFTICHEGYYPFRDKGNWPSEFLDDPKCFSPVLGGVLTILEWKKYNFSEEDEDEILSKAPDLVVVRPDPELKIPHVESNFETKGERKNSEIITTHSPSVVDQLPPTLPSEKLNRKPQNQ